MPYDNDALSGALSAGPGGGLSAAQLARSPTEPDTEQLLSNLMSSMSGGGNNDALVDNLTKRMQDPNRPLRERFRIASHLSDDEMMKNILQQYPTQDLVKSLSRGYGYDYIDDASGHYMRNELARRGIKAGPPPGRGPNFGVMR